MVRRVLVDMVFRVHEMQETNPGEIKEGNNSPLIATTRLSAGPLQRRCWQDGHLPGSLQAMAGLHGHREHSNLVHFLLLGLSSDQPVPAAHPQLSIKVCPNT